MSKLYVNDIYSKSGATEAINIDNSGRVIMPQRPMFKVYRTANINYGTADVDVKMTGWDDDTSAGSVNVNNFWDTTNDKAVIPVTGMYMFELKGFKGTGTYGQIWLIMKVNGGQAKGADFRLNRSNSGFGWEGVNFNAHLYLDEGDYVEFYFNSATGNAYFHPSSGNIYSGICAHLVG